MTRLPVLILTVTTACSAYAQSEWPQFRGPTGQGHAVLAPLQWSETDNIVWRARTPGRGWSSPVVQGDRVWLTAAIETPDLWNPDATEIVEPNPRLGGGPESVELLVLAYDYSTGRQLLQVPVARLADAEPIHALNSYASPTPVLLGGRVFCSFGSDHIVAIEADSGEIAWRASFKIEQYVGAGSSLAVYNPSDSSEPSVLLVVCDGMQEQYIVGLDTDTGKTLWKTDRPPIKAASPQAQKSFSTPILVSVGDHTQAIVPTSQWICGYDPSDGQELWRFRHGEGFSIVPAPVYEDGVVYFSTGFHPPTMLALRVPGAATTEARRPH